MCSNETTMNSDNKENRDFFKSGFPPNFESQIIKLGDNIIKPKPKPIHVLSIFLQNIIISIMIWKRF